MRCLYSTSPCSCGLARMRTSPWPARMSAPTSGSVWGNVLSSVHGRSRPEAWFLEHALRAICGLMCSATGSAVARRGGPSTMPAPSPMRTSWRSLRSGVWFVSLCAVSVTIRDVRSARFAWWLVETVVGGLIGFGLLAAVL